MPPARSEVQGCRLPPVDTIQTQHMCFCKIANVEIVPHTGPVRSWIVIAKNLQGRTLTLNRLKHRRDQMGFWITHFSDLSILIRTRCIEIPESDEMQPVRSRIRFKSKLKCKLGRDIRVNGTSQFAL